MTSRPGPPLLDLTGATLPWAWSRAWLHLSQLGTAGARVVGEESDRVPAPRRLVAVAVGAIGAPAILWIPRERLARALFASWRRRRRHSQAPAA